MGHELTRRAFLGDAALVGAASVIGVNNVRAAGEEAAEATPPPPRRSSFDTGWKFTKGALENAQSAAFADETWTPLDLPHDWSIAGSPSQDAPSGPNGGYLPTGVGWYRKTFRLPQSDAGRRIMLQFDGVYQCSDVWINGQHLGYRPYGFSTFCYDLSP